MVTNETYSAAVDRIDKLEAVLRAIVHEYDQTYNADCDGGVWKSVASIPANVMKRAKELLK